MVEQPLFIIASDLHLEDRVPPCRTDDYFATMRQKLSWFYEHCAKNPNATPLVAGDVFDKAKSSPAVEKLAINYLPQNSIIVPGQHDLPYHAINKFSESSLSVVQDARPDVCVLLPEHEYTSVGVPELNTEIEGFWWGRNITDIEHERDMCLDVALIHTFVWNEDRPWPGAGGFSAHEFMRTLNRYDLIVTGDNHETFIASRGSQKLINPGSMMRRTADQIDKEPKFFKYYADGGIEEVAFPYKAEAVSRKHVDAQNARDENIEAYVKKLEEGTEIQFDFEKMLEQAHNHMSKDACNELIDIWEKAK